MPLETPGSSSCHLLSSSRESAVLEEVLVTESLAGHLVIDDKIEFLGEEGAHPGSQMQCCGVPRVQLPAEVTAPPT